MSRCVQEALRAPVWLEMSQVKEKRRANGRSVAWEAQTHGAEKGRLFLSSPSPHVGRR